jgi:hypothetical protein
MAATAVDRYFATLPPTLAEPARATRAIVDDALADATCTVLWQAPTWLLGREPVCFLRAVDGEHLLLGFWHAGSIDDPSGRIRAHGSIMGHAEVRSAADVDAALFAHWLRQAREFARRDAEARARRDGG